MYTVAIQLDGRRNTRGLFATEGAAWTMLNDIVARMDNGGRYDVTPINNKMAFAISDASGIARGHVGVTTV